LTGIGEVPWLNEARALIGLKEIKGREHEPKILKLWSDAGLSYSDDETAWCAGFVGGCLARAKVKPSGSPAARSYLHWGRSVKDSKLELIPPGAVLVFERPPNAWEGHVGFAVGYTADGFLKVLGGNQSDSVSIADIIVGRLLDARWPVEFAGDLRLLRKLPLMQRTGAASTNEA
jgi:uncharacterized protein (TIGR02594 family)